MASRYSKVQTSLWDSQKFNELSDFGKVVYLYLLSCPHGNSAGFFRLKESYAIADLRCTDKRYRAAILEIESAELISTDENIILVHQFLKFNAYTNKNHAKGSRKEIQDVITSRLYGLFYIEISEFCPDYAVVEVFEKPIESLSKAYQEPFTDAGKAFSTETYTETKTETYTETNNQDHAQAHVDSPLEKAITDFKAHRKALKKPMTPRAVELMLSKLDKLANTDAEKIEILNQSIESGWLGIFEIKNKDRASPQPESHPKKSYTQEV
jgi:hypothetical protein